MAKYFTVKYRGTSKKAVAGRTAMLVYAAAIESEDFKFAQEIREAVHTEERRIIREQHEQKST